MKILTIINCGECPYLKQYMQCGKTRMTINEYPIIPHWCPLQEGNQPEEISDEEIERVFPTDLAVLCKQKDIPININADQGAYLTECQYINSRKQIGAKWYRNKLKEKS